MLAAYGTPEQKERWLTPLLNQEIFSAYSMTEPQGGSDPNLFKTHATRDGDEWVISGEKWFTSAGRAADILFVMCTNGMFVVPRDTPGVGIQPYPSTHNHIVYNDAREGHRRAPDGAGGHRRLVRRDQHAAAAGVVDRLDHRQLVDPGGPHPDRGLQVHDGQGAA